MAKVPSRRPVRSSERIERMEQGLHCLHLARHATHALLDVMEDLGDKRTSLSGDDLYALLMMIHEKQELAEQHLNASL